MPYNLVNFINSDFFETSGTTDIICKVDGIYRITVSNNWENLVNNSVKTIWSILQVNNIDTYGDTFSTTDNNGTQKYATTYNSIIHRVQVNQSVRSRNIMRIGTGNFNAGFTNIRVRRGCSFTIEYIGTP